VTQVCHCRKPENPDAFGDSIDGIRYLQVLSSECKKQGRNAEFPRLARKIPREYAIYLRRRFGRKCCWIGTGSFLPGSQGLYCSMAGIELLGEATTGSVRFISTTRC